MSGSTRAKVITVVLGVFVPLTAVFAVLSMWSDVWLGMKVWSPR